MERLLVQFNGDATESVAGYALDDWSASPWAASTIASPGQKFGTGCLKQEILGYPDGGRGDQWPAGIDWCTTGSQTLQDFTIQCWVKLPVCPGLFASFGDGWMWWDNPGDSEFDPPGSTWDPFTVHVRGYDAVLEIAGVAIPFSDNARGDAQHFLYDMDAWRHVAVTRSSGTVYAFLDGVLKGTVAYADPVNYPMDTYTKFQLQLDTITWRDEWCGSLGEYIKFYPGPEGTAKFYADEYIISDTALWTANFTPPVSELGSSSFESATKLILHMNTDTVFEDSSTEAHTVTPSGTAQIDTVSFVLGDGSGLFATRDKLSIPDNNYWSIFNSDWFIHFRFRLPTITASVYTIFEQAVSSNTFMRCTYDVTTHQLIFNVKVEGTNKILMTASANFTANTWYHIALTAYGWKKV